MLAYVMDGKLDDAISSVKTAIERRRGKLRMDKGATLIQSRLRPLDRQVKETLHAKGGRKETFAIHHIFVPIR